MSAALVDLTGGVGESIDMTDEDVRFEIGDGTFWKRLKRYNSKGADHEHGVAAGPTYSACMCSPRRPRHEHGVAAGPTYSACMCSPRRPRLPPGAGHEHDDGGGTYLLGAALSRADVEDKGGLGAMQVAAALPAECMLSAC